MQMMIYYCGGCRRKCRGSINPCLDCEHALDLFREDAYAHGVNAGLEWGIQNPLSPRELPREYPKLPYRATRYLAEVEEEKVYAYAYTKGFRRGTREAQTRRKIYAHVLEELLLDVGRRKAMVYCLGITLDYLRRHPRQADWMDFNVFHLVNAMF